MYVKKREYIENRRFWIVGGGPNKYHAFLSRVAHPHLMNGICEIMIGWLPDTTNPKGLETSSPPARSRRQEWNQSLPFKIFFARAATIQALQIFEERILKAKKFARHLEFIDREMHQGWNMGNKLYQIFFRCIWRVTKECQRTIRSTQEAREGGVIDHCPLMMTKTQAL